MRTLLTSTFGLLIGLLFAEISCNVEGQSLYPKDTTISSLTGEPHDSSTFYFPTTITTAHKIVQTGLDSFQLKWYSTSMRPTKEPILFNFYLGHDIYRFVWLRAFSPPVVFTLHKDGEKVWLQTKLLDNIPREENIGHIQFTPPGEHVKPSKVDSITHVVHLAKIKSDEMKSLTIEEWNHFEKLISYCGFWNMQTSIHELGMDGSQWIIEGHQKNRYWLVDRWTPKNNYRKCGEYLIELSALKEEIY
jgi:hypothetical protein